MPDKILQLAGLGKMTRNGAEGPLTKVRHRLRGWASALATPAAIPANFRNALLLLIRAWKCPIHLSTVTSILACGTWHFRVVDHREGSSGLLIGRKREPLAGVVETRLIMIGAPRCCRLKEMTGQVGCIAVCGRDRLLGRF